MVCCCPNAAVWKVAGAGKEEVAPKANAGLEAGCETLGPLPKPNIVVGAACAVAAGAVDEKKDGAAAVAGTGAPNIGKLLVTVCAANDMPKPVGFSTGAATAGEGMKAGAGEEGCAVGLGGACTAGLVNANKELAAGAGVEPNMLVEGANTEGVGACTAVAGLLRLGVVMPVGAPAPNANERFEAAEEGVGGLPNPPPKPKDCCCEAGAEAGVGRAVGGVKLKRLGEAGDGAADPNALGELEAPNAKGAGEAAAVEAAAVVAPKSGAWLVWAPEAAPKRKLPVVGVAAADREGRVLAAALVVTPKMGDGSGEDEGLLEDGWAGEGVGCA